MEIKVYSPPIVTHCSGCGRDFAEHGEPWGRGAKFCPGGCLKFIPPVDARRRSYRKAGRCYRCGGPRSVGKKTCRRCRRLESWKRVARREAAAAQSR